MVTISALKLTGVFTFLGGIVLVLLPWFWTIGMSHPPNLEIQLIFLSSGLLVGGWISGIGAFLLWENNKYITYGLASSGFGLLAVILIAGTESFV